MIIFIYAFFDNSKREMDTVVFIFLIAHWVKLLRLTFFFVRSENID
jgi:hypothetical protein